jgi:hypothetical protein
MKIKLIAAIVAITSPVYGVVVTLDSGGFSQAVVDTTNTAIPVGGGFIAVGFFSTYTSSTIFSDLSGSQLEADFNVFGPSQVFAGVGFEGFYALSVDGGRVGASSPFLNKTLITLIGNGSTLANSTEALIYQHTATWPNDDGAPVPAALTAVLGDNGNTTAFWFGAPTGGTTPILGSDIPAISMAKLIPEPSTALLGALGALGLLRRRRI